MIDAYLPVLKKFDELYLVTLTAKSCYAKHLSRRMRKTVQAFQLIKERFKKRYQRGKGPKFVGIKSLECNFNPKARTYNPHFHVIVPSWELANLLKRERMKLWTNRFTNGWAQDIRKVDNTEKALIELIKYGSKIFTEPIFQKVD